jgi:hypothetical protein
LAIAGFLKNLLFSLEVSPHDAGAANAAMPLGRLSIGSLVAQANCEHRCHF